MGFGDDALWRWSVTPQAWGPKDAGWQVWAGPKAIDGLCELLDTHLDEHSQGYPAAIGCVPWFTSKRVEDRQLKMHACCVVIDKGAFLPRRLVNADLGFPNTALRGLTWTTADVAEDGKWIGPYTQPPEHLLGPVRVLGWKEGERKPLLHAKLLILGELTDVWYYPDEAPSYSEWRFVPKKVWHGSANWTALSQTHLEHGVVCDDPSLVETLTSFVTNLIGYSEPVGTTHDTPQPNLVYMEFDDAAMAEAAEEARLAHLEDLAVEAGEEEPPDE